MEIFKSKRADRAKQSDNVRSESWLADILEDDVRRDVATLCQEVDKSLLGFEDVLEQMSLDVFDENEFERAVTLALEKHYAPLIQLSKNMVEDARRDRDIRREAIKKTRDAMEIEKIELAAIINDLDDLGETVVMSCLSRDHMDKQLSTLNRKLGQTEEQIKDLNDTVAVKDRKLHDKENEVEKLKLTLSHITAEKSDALVLGPSSLHLYCPDVPAPGGGLVGDDFRPETPSSMRTDKLATTSRASLVPSTPRLSGKRRDGSLINQGGDLLPLNSAASTSSIVPTKRLENSPVLLSKTGHGYFENREFPPVHDESFDMFASYDDSKIGIDSSADIDEARRSKRIGDDKKLSVLSISFSSSDEDDKELSSRPQLSFSPPAAVDSLRESSPFTLADQFSNSFKQMPSAKMTPWNSFVVSSSVLNLRPSKVTLTRRRTPSSRRLPISTTAPRKTPLLPSRTSLIDRRMPWTSAAPIPNWSDKKTIYTNQPIDGQVIEISSSSESGWSESEYNGDDDDDEAGREKLESIPGSQDKPSLGYKGSTSTLESVSAVNGCMSRISFIGFSSDSENE